jgi:hypothetical protein
VSGCPDDALVADVLDRTATAAVARDVRDHLARCDACLQRHGALFEIELWSAALSPQPAAPPEPAAPSRSVERIAVAATLALAATLAGRLGPMRPAAPRCAPEPAVLALSMRETTRDAKGTIEVRRTLERGAPARLRIEERIEGRDGAAVVHERWLPLAAADSE